MLSRRESIQAQAKSKNEEGGKPPTLVICYKYPRSYARQVFRLPAWRTYKHASHSMGPLAVGRIYRESDTREVTFSSQFNASATIALCPYVLTFKLAFVQPGVS